MPESQWQMDRDIMQRSTITEFAFVCSCPTKECNVQYGKCAPIIDPMSLAHRKGVGERPIETTQQARGGALGNPSKGKVTSQSDCRGD